MKISRDKKSSANSAPEAGGGHVHGPHCNHKHALVCELSIRIYRPEDHKQLTEVWKSGDIALDDTDSAKSIRDILKKNKNYYRIFVAEAQMFEQKNNKPYGVPIIAGGTILAFDSRRATVYHLAVHPDFRSAGIGKALLDTCENQARLWGAKHLRLTARTDSSRAAAREMYEKAGWKADKSVWVYAKKIERAK